MCVDRRVLLSLRNFSGLASCQGIVKTQSSDGELLFFWLECKQLQRVAINKHSAGCGDHA
jgi:hypothetical protein